MLSDQLEDDNLLRDANTTPRNTPVDVSFDPVPLDFVDYFMPRDSSHESSLEGNEDAMTESEMLAIATEFEMDAMADLRYSMLDLEDEPIMDAIYCSIVDVDNDSSLDSKNHTAIEFEGQPFSDGTDEFVSDLEDTPPVAPLDEGALAPAADNGTFTPNTGVAKENQISDQKRAKEGKRKQDSREETMEIKLLRAESKKEKLMHVIRDLEKVIADKEDDYRKAAAELEELACKFRDAQHRTLLREAYIEQMHAWNQQMVHEKKLSEFGKQKSEREMQYEIDRQKEQNLHFQIKLGEAIEGVRKMFDAHTKDYADRMEAAELYQEHVEDQNARLLELLHFMEDIEQYAWNLQISDKDVFYEAEVNLLRSGTVDWTGPLPATDYYPNRIQLATQCPRGNDEISNDSATSNEGIAIDTFKSGRGDAYTAISASWSSAGISDDYTLSNDQLDTPTSSISKFYLAEEGKVNLEASLLRLSEEDFEVVADEEYMEPETELDAGEDIDTQISSSHASPAMGEWPSVKTRRPLLLACGDAVGLPGPATPKKVSAAASKKLRGRRPRANKTCFDSLLHAPLTSPFSVCFDEDSDTVDTVKPLPYFAMLPSLSPPSKRVCLSRLRLLPWDFPTRNNPSGQVLFQERLAQVRPSLNEGLGQPYLSLTGNSGGVQTSPDPQALSRAATEGSGWSISIGNYLRAKISGSFSEDIDGACVESSIIIYYARVWKAFAALATPQEYVLVAIRMLMMCTMMWLAYTLRAYDEWKLANDEPTTLEMILEPMLWRTMQIGLVDTARFGVHEWLEERTWLG